VKVLLADSGETMRGGQWQCLYLARGLRERGVSVRMLVRGELGTAARAGGFEAHEWGLAAMWRLCRWAELTHTQDARSHTVATLVSRCPLVVSRRVAFPLRRSAASRWKYRRAARYIAVSQFVAARLADAGVSAGRITVVPDGVPEPERPPVPFSKRPVHVLALRTSDLMKGDDLIDKAAALGGFDLTWTDRLLDDLPLARVFLYISRSEGLGSGALLASAHGVAVVASREGGLPEIVEHEVTGLLVENRADSIASAILRLESGPSFAEKLGRCGRARAQSQFSIDRMVDGTLDVYRSVLR
jgi:glycosyltransferase involved in cell wall biosynthesis